MRPPQEGCHRWAEDDMILTSARDGGPPAAQLKSAGTIVWERPCGRVRVCGLENGTKQTGPGDCRIACLQHCWRWLTPWPRLRNGIEKQVGYISTGGGAFPGSAGRQDLARVRDSGKKRAAGNRDRQACSRPPCGWAFFMGNPARTGPVQRHPPKITPMTLSTHRARPPRKNQSMLCVASPRALPLSPT